jgi:prepilin-type N-terminal cleavage/methylation domain-containing protein
MKNMNFTNMNDNSINKTAKDPLKKSKKAGFTIVELMVVTAVLSVLVAFSVGALASVTRRKATKVGKLIDSELTTLASNAYSRDGVWRLEFEYNEEDDCYVLTQQYCIDDENWVDFSSVSLSSDVDISFGGEDYDEEKSGGTHYVAVSREKGCYLTDGAFEGYFCDKIFVHSASKVVAIHMSPESGGHRVID